MMSRVGQRRKTSVSNAVFASSIIILPLLPFASPLFQLPEFAPPQVIYSRDLVPLLLAPWTSPSSMFRVLSRLLQSALLFHLPKGSIFPCYFLWIAIALTRTLVGFLLSRGVGWAYPRLFNHWALYEPIGGYGPPLVAYLIASRVHPDFTVFLTYLKWHKWEATESLVLLVACALLSGLDYAPWTYGVAIGLAILVLALRTIFSPYFNPETTYSHPSPDSLRESAQKHIRVSIQMAFLLLVFISLPNIISPFFTSSPILQMPSPSADGIPTLEIILLSYPRPNDIPPSPDHHSILSQAISSYLPYVSPSTVLSVFTHAAPSTHPSFSHAQHQFKDAPITFYADLDTHPDMHPGQYLHLAEAFRWASEKGAWGAEWVMVVEDDFPICGEWGWHGVLDVMQTLRRGHASPSPTHTKLWGGFVGTGGRCVSLVSEDG